MAHNCLICGHISSQNTESARSINLLSKSSKNIHNSVHLQYTTFQIMYTILYIQHTQFYDLWTFFFTNY